jgi:hypothetical protein
VGAECEEEGEKARESKMERKREGEMERGRDGGREGGEGEGERKRVSQCGREERVREYEGEGERV